MSKKTTIVGMIAGHSKEPYLGQITVSGATGLITEVSSLSAGSTTDADYIYDKDTLIFPGMGDVHIHAREDMTKEQCHKEEYQTAADAALHGGVVQMCAMPNTPNPVTTKTDMKWHRNHIAKMDHPVSILNYLGIDKKTKPLGKPGEHFYKLYFGKSVGDLTVMYASELDVILARYKGHHISFHVEYEPVVQAHADGRTHSERRPVECVNEGLRLLLPLIEKYKIVTKLCHWSTGGESFDLIREYQERGCKIVLEVSPLHLLFDTSMTDKDPSLWAKVQMNPAIQSATHRKHLIEGLRDGFIDFLATDHAPHTEQEKYSAFEEFSKDRTKKTNKEIAQDLSVKDKKLFYDTCEKNGMSGAPWLDTYALVCLHLMKKHGFSPQRIAHVAAYMPGEFVNKHLKAQFAGKKYGKGFGQVEKGYVGSFTVLSTKGSTTVKREELKTKSAWSPLEDRKFAGKIEAVFVAGQKVG